ncbi:ABC transporter permease [Xanthocytophaga agilis]|uniref:ABC transporter permease n=1 Tax=Xanthocytophaga agilis TaxID=3048010 RepID=A0AAE3R716_9BACT|nr:ABC transporter permease [Xanthocytophaga agilis]MDJ1502767.1 ABC transporter permease [Xanthocytophaga agilis]
MLKNYLLIAIRNLWRNKLYSAINIGGLALGLAVSMLIMLYVVHEYSYDHFHTHSGKIVRTIYRAKMGENFIQMNLFSMPFGPAVKQNSAHVEDFVRMRTSNRVVIKTDDDQKFYEEKFLFADPSVFTVFSFPLLKGNVQHVLKKPFSVVISEQIAHKYFGDKDPVGQTLTYDEKHLFEITGVVKDAPSNSTLTYDFIASLPSYDAIQKQEGPDYYASQNAKIGPGAYETYFLLKDGSDLPLVQKAIPSVVTKEEGSVLQFQYVLDPLLNIHFGNNFGDSSNLQYVWIFMGVAVLILFLALFNYMSLSTARATKRAKEVGVRKVMGADRKRIAGQFYMESMLISLVSFVLGLVLLQFLKPVFLNTLQLKIDTDFLFSPLFVMVLTGLLIVTILIAGSYPSLVLSGFSPIQALKGKVSMTGTAVRKGFIVFQFAVSMVLIAGSIFIQQQIAFIRNQKIGMNKEQVLMIPLDKEFKNNYIRFRNDIRQQTGVRSVAAAGSPLFSGGWNVIFTKTPDGQQDISINYMIVDEEFLKTLEIEWAIPPAIESQISLNDKIIINQKAIAKLNLKGNPIGKQLEWDGAKEIAGVVKNFNFSSLKYEINDLALKVVKDTSQILASQGGHLFVRVDPKANLPKTLAQIEHLYTTYQTKKPFEYQFLDDAFDKMYKSEHRLAAMMKAFTGVAIFIACLGLFGLIAFVAEMRTKEIGIRKVLGASVSSIVLLLCQDFIRLVVFAIILATPIAWYVTNQWLQEFAYRIEISWIVFALAGIGAIVLAVCTISIQAISAARVNPIKSLRTE